MSQNMTNNWFARQSKAKKETNVVYVGFPDDKPKVMPEITEIIYVDFVAKRVKMKVIVSNKGE